MGYVSGRKKLHPDAHAQHTGLGSVSVEVAQAVHTGSCRCGDGCV